MNKLFPPFSKLRLSVDERVNILVRRHDQNYYVDYSLEDIEQLPEVERPYQVVTMELRVSF